MNAHATREIKQRLFNKSCRGLARQGFYRSMHAEQKDMFGSPIPPLCAYRDEHGRRCAIGHLIPDHLYSPGYEGLDVVGLMATEQPPLFGLEPHEAEDETTHFGDELRQFLIDLQFAHDTAERPLEMIANLTRVADKHNLLLPDAVVHA